MFSKLHLVLVDEQPETSAALAATLAGEPWTIHPAATVAEAQALLAVHAIDAVVADVCLPGALDFLHALAASHPDTSRIALAAAADNALLAAAVNQGEVVRIFTKPWNDETVRAALAQVREGVELRDEVARLLEVTQQQNEALRSWTEQLEKRVAERSRALLEAETKVAQHERLAAIGQLAGGVAHEINNPLGAIVVFARTAARDLPPQHPAATDLREIQKAARQAQKIVQSLLTFSRRSAPEERTLIDLAALIKQSQPLLQAVTKTPVHYQIGTAPFVRGNASRLQQVLVNLVSNADQAAGGSGSVHVALDCVDGRARLEVTDEGPGIAADALPHIFEPFFTTKPQGAGTGLGLAIAYGIVREHDGEITAENRAPHGSRFCVRLPAAEQMQVA